MNLFNGKRHDSMESADRDLVQRMARGDRTALATLFRRYHSGLVQFLSQLTRQVDVIENVIDDTFWIAWQTATDLPSRSRVSTWLLGITYQCALKALRLHDDRARIVDDLTLDERTLIAMVSGAGQDKAPAN